MVSDSTVKNRPLVKSWVAWLLALWVALAIHVDWHLGRPGEHHNLSFHLPHHWIFGILVSAHLAWYISRRWGPGSFWRASVFIILVGILIGQGLEPLLEVFEGHMDWSPLTNLVRWHIFLSFVLAGTVTYFVVAWLIQKRRARA